MNYDSEAFFGSRALKKKSKSVEFLLENIVPTYDSTFSNTNCVCCVKLTRPIDENVRAHVILFSDISFTHDNTKSFLKDCQIF